MRTMLALFLILTLLSPVCAAELDLSSPTSSPQPSVVPQLAGQPLLDAPPMTLNCVSAMLLEPESGTIIFQLNADSKRAVASVTKVMTILLTLEAIDSGRISPDDRITVSADAAGMGGSQVLLDVGETQTIAILLKSMIVGSANDAAVALAEVLYGSEELCAAQMNTRAQELGMTDTHFVNCTGLPAEGQYTTARDVAIMSMAMFSHPLYYEFSKIWLDNVDHGDGRVTQLTNTNKLIRLYDGCDGGKTGSTDEAGYCISATARRGDMRLIAVVLGANAGQTRFDEARAMLEYGFAGYKLFAPVVPGDALGMDVSVRLGAEDQVGAVCGGGVNLLLRKGEEKNITLEAALTESVAAPVRKGDMLGEIRVKQGDAVVAVVPAVAGENVELPGIIASLLRIRDGFMIRGLNTSK